LQSLHAELKRISGKIVAEVVSLYRILLIAGRVGLVRKFILIGQSAALQV
jgi:hypothetical protein